MLLLVANGGTSSGPTSGSKGSIGSGGQVILTAPGVRLNGQKRIRECSRRRNCLMMVWVSR